MAQQPCQDPMPHEACPATWCPKDPGKRYFRKTHWPRNLFALPTASSSPRHCEHKREALLYTVHTDCPPLPFGRRSHVVGSRCYPEVYGRSDCLPCGSHRCCRRLPGHPPRLPGTAQSPQLSSPSEVMERVQTDGTLPHCEGFLGRGVAVGIVEKRGSGTGWGSPGIMQ